MKVGVMTFSYATPSQREKFARNGLISINLGDYMQTIAVRSALAAIGVAAGDIVDIDRDTLPDYRGEPVRLVMNGCFYDWCFPLPDAVTPIFIGFQARREVIARHADELRRHQPIGCRDEETAAELDRHGVAAFVTGCLTLTLPPREAPPAKGRTFIVYGDGAGALPAQILPLIPRDRLAGAEFVHQRKLMHECPLSAEGRRQAEAHARHLLDRYREHASFVLTPLHHAATPSAAVGIPVVICRKAADTRFGHVRQFLPHYLPAEFRAIDWAVAAADLAEHRRATLDRLAAALSV